MRERSM